MNEVVSTTQAADATPATGNAFHGAALEYAARAWRVVPVCVPLGVANGCNCASHRRVAEPCNSPGKRPTVKGWTERTFTPETWANGATLNIGVVTGEISGIVVIDVDAGGEETLEELERELGALPATAQARTGSGGRHLFFKHPGGVVIRNDAKRKLGPGLDVRGDGGFVVVAPSKHKSGSLYQWIEGAGPDALELAHLPAAWLARLADRPQPSMPAPLLRPASMVTNLRMRAAAYLAHCDPAIEGSNGSGALMHATSALVRGFQLGEAEAFEFLAGEYNPRCVPPWSEKELRHAIASAAAKSDKAWGYLLDEKQSATRISAVSISREPREDDGEEPPPPDSENPPGPGARRTAPATSWKPLLRFDEVKVPPFPVDALPAWLREFVEDVAAFSQVHPDMPAMLALSALSTACAGRFHVSVRPDYNETLNLYIAAVMDSGDRKSGVFKSCTQPLREVEAEMLLQARPAIAAAAQKRKNLEARLKHLQAKIAKDDDDASRLQIETDAMRTAKQLDELPPTLVPRLLADDITPQALGILLQSCGEQLGVFAPEGGIFKTLGGRYSDGQADLDLVLKAYSGEPVTVDRVSRAGVRLEHPLITFGLTIQPRVLRDLAETPGAIELGFAGRFLYSLPGSYVGERAAAAPAMRGEGAIEYARKIRGLLSARVPGQSTAAITMGPGALAVRDAFHDEIEPRLKPGSGDLAAPGLKEWARKLVGTMARLAGILHACQHATPPAVEVSAETANAAVRLCRYLVDHARAAFLTMGTDVDIERAKMVLDWLRRKGVTTFTLREVFESKRKSFEDKATLLRKTLELLEEHGYIAASRAEHEGPGRPSERYAVRPELATEWTRSADSADRLRGTPPKKNGTEREK